MPLFGLPNSSGPDDPAGHALLLAIAFVAVIFVALVVAAIYSIRAIQAWNQAFAPDVADGAARELAQDTPRDIEIPPLNGWSAAITGQMVYGPAPTATKFKPPKTHCLLCIVETCDEWGIPLDEVRTIGRQKLCKRHRHFDLASAGRGA